MTNTSIFITQLASIISFITALFILYRMLVSQKEATIQLLKEKIDYLKDQLSTAQQNSPDLIAKKLSDRIIIISGEIDRLSIDQEKNERLIKEKECVLLDTKKELEILRKKVSQAQELFSLLLCPYCKAPKALHEYQPESRNGKDRIIEVVGFECGYIEIDGKAKYPCSRNIEREDEGSNLDL